jgi:[acyl-carrier-protein] S-malonyltransferase
VRWTATVQAIAGRGITDIVEVGPGRVLAGLARKIDANLKAYALSDGNGLADAKAALG